MAKVIILGSTGSIGVNTLDVIKNNLDKYEVFALTANTNVDKLLAQVKEFKPKYALMADKKSALLLQELIKNNKLTTEVLSKDDYKSLISLSDVKIVVAAIVGSAGLMPTFYALKAGKKVLLANKEALVMAGSLFAKELEISQGSLIPVDSEHNAIFQCLEQDKKYNNNIEKIIITASGGPFLHTAISDLAKVTPAEAVAHPNWAMGKKISVDSATLVNKALEIIEAYWLFKPSKVDDLDILLHPQSLVHGIVEYIDGTYLCALASHDMRMPIANALAYPNRIKSGIAKLDFTKFAKLEFYPVDYKKFPCAKLGFMALKMGKSASIVFNAANEVAVDLFLHNKIGYLDIYRIINTAMENFNHVVVNSIEDVVAIDKEARKGIYQICYHSSTL